MYLFVLLVPHKNLFGIEFWARFPVIATEMVLLGVSVGNVLLYEPGCIGPESCSTRGFRVVVGGMLSLLWDC